MIETDENWEPLEDKLSKVKRWIIEHSQGSENINAKELLNFIESL